MKIDFTNNVGLTIVLSIGLLAVDRLPAFMDRFQSFRGLVGRSATLHRIEQLQMRIHNTDLNPEDLDALAAGYYEGLHKNAEPAGLPIERDDVRFRDDFLRYELRPDVRRRYPAGMRITNSLGLANPEYTYPKPPHTRRIALLGDSISLGPYGQDYEARLEERLSQSDVTPDVQSFQILNFAVYGYSVLQMMDVALDKAPQFHPDVYMVALTNLETMPKAGWRTHVGRLVVSGTDLKYDFLRGVIARAGIRPTDHLPTIRVKLAPFYIPVTRWALEQIRDHATSQGARMIILLVPAPVDPDLSASDFNHLRGAVDGIGVPVIDLRDTFRGANLSEVRVEAKTDVHPNAKGHEMIFTNLYAKLRSQPDAWAAVVGHRADTVDKPNSAVKGKSF